MASKRNRKKVKFKWTKELIILIAALAILLTVTIILAIPSQDKKNLTKWNEAITTYNTDNNTSYSTLGTEVHLKEVSGSDEKLFKKVRDIADTDGYTYFFYGTLSDATYLEQLSKINSMAIEYEIESVYLVYATFYEDAKADEKLDTVSFRQTCDSYESILNTGKDGDATEIDLTVYPALFVYKNNSLIFNTQVGKDSQEYSWSIYLQKAFSFEMSEKANSEN